VHVYLVRHGEAKHEAIDPERHLTDRGADEVRRIATDAVSHLGVRPKRVFHSRKVRARQTAEIWAGLVGAGLAETDGLAPNDEPSIWAVRLETEGDDVMLVGHLPHLERLAGLLVTADAKQAVAGFGAGGLVGLERKHSGWGVTVARP
jgi:phosphohistidine phosphatase